MVIHMDKCSKCDRQLYQDETIRLTKDGEMFHMNCIPHEPVKVVWKFSDYVEPMVEASLRILKEKGLIK